MLEAYAAVLVILFNFRQMAPLYKITLLNLVLIDVFSKHWS